MSTRLASRGTSFAGILSIALAGCGTAGSAIGESGGGSASLSSSSGSATTTGTSAESGGATVSVGTTKSASGGMKSTDETRGRGGTTASRGSSTGSTGRAGTTVGGGSQSDVDTQLGSGGRSGKGGGTSLQQSGWTGIGGQVGHGGQAGPSSGGSSEHAGTTTASCGQLVGEQRLIAFGTLLDPQAVMCVARQLAKSLSSPSSSAWQAKGDQHREYHFADANTDEAYRLYVPTNWDGKSSLPLAMFLHGAGSNENTYVDMNDKQMVTLAQEHGYILVAPLGDKGAYGNFLRLSSPFGKAQEAAKLMAEVTSDSERTNELSERDVIQVLELVLAEYPVDRSSMFLFGHSMGSGGTWYVAGKYADYWRGIAPMSGPFVQETGYPWEDLHEISIFVTEGTQTPSLDGSHALRDWLRENSFDADYKEVNADHGGMIPLVLPDVFDFFDRSRAH